MQNNNPGADNGLTVKRGWLIILAFLMQVAVITTVSDPEALALKRAVLAITSLMLLLGILPNLRWWSFRILALGFLMNTLVIAVNGGLMPVTPEDNAKVSPPDQRVEVGQTPPHSKNILLNREDARLYFLADTIYLSWPSPKVYSAGDAVLALGLVAFALEAAYRGLRARREKTDPLAEAYDNG